jgi:serine protease Do
MNFFAFVFLTLLSFSAYAITPDQEPVVQAVKKVLPTVVNIYTEGYVEEQVGDPFDQFYEQFFGGGFSRGGNVLMAPVRNLGSGLMITDSGYIVTNNHVVQRAKDLKIKVTLSDGKTYEAKMIRSDEDQDLALIKIEGKEPFPCLNLNQLSPNLLGETVIAIGNPIGYESSVSMGILSARNRTVKLEGGTMEGLLQTDAAINPGNSGGPLVDIDGNLVGLNSAKMAASHNVLVENIGFAIPAARVKAFVEDSIAIAEGKKKEPPKVNPVVVLKDRLGLTVQDLTDDLADAFGYRGVEGLLVADVEKDSPADKAGIQKGMIVVGLDSFRVRTVADIPHQITRIKPKDKVQVTLMIASHKGNFLIQRTASVMLTAR